MHEDVVQKRERNANSSPRLWTFLPERLQMAFQRLIHSEDSHDPTLLVAFVFNEQQKLHTAALNFRVG